MELVVGLFGYLRLWGNADQAAFSGVETHEPFRLPLLQGLEVQLQLFTVFWHLDYPVEQAVIGKETYI